MRIKVIHLGVVGAALLGLTALAVKLRRSEPEPSAASSAPDAGSPFSRLARRGTVPRFQTVETPAQPPPAVPPPRFEPPPVAPPPPPAPKSEHEQLRERASKDGYVFREANSNTLWLVQKGSRFKIGDEQELRAMGYRPDQVEVVQPGALNFLASRPSENTLFRERGDPRVFFFENGQKRWILSGDTFYKLGHKVSDIKVVPNGSLGQEAVGAPIP